MSGWGRAPHRLILDRTDWKIGRREVNLLVLAVATRRHRLALMWTVLDRPGNSGAPERIALIVRYIARFGPGSIGLLLADREFIGADWFNFLIRNDITFAIRMSESPRATTEEGRNGTLGSLLAAPGGRRPATVTLDNMATAGTPGPALAIRAVLPRDRRRKAVIVATNRPWSDPLGRCRRRIRHCRSDQWRNNRSSSKACSPMPSAAASTSRTPASPVPENTTSRWSSSPSPWPGPAPPPFSGADACRERPTAAQETHRIPGEVDLPHRLRIPPPPPPKRPTPMSRYLEPPPANAPRRPESRVV